MKLSQTQIWQDRLAASFFAACGLATVLTTVAIVLVLATESLEFFSEVSLGEFLFDTQWTPLFTDKHFGIWPLLCGTFVTAIIAMIVAVPLGLCAAIYLSEFCPPWLRKIIKPMIELLAGIPTLVYGYFALVVLTPALQKVVPNLAGFNALSPGIIMGVMIVPMIASLSEDALQAVPRYLREGAWALGGDSMQTTVRIVVPAALSGIAASVILALSRAIGETMIVTIAAGQQPTLSLDPRVPMETMTAYIVQIGLGDTPTGTLEYQSIFAVGAMLFILTFCTNIAAQSVAKRFRYG